jgi:hypothetical protein
MALCIDDHQQPEDTSFPTTPFGFKTPARFVAKHEISESLESPPRKKHRRNISSFVDSYRADLGTTVSCLDFHHDDALILAKLDVMIVQPSNVSALKDSATMKYNDICGTAVRTGKAGTRLQCAARSA